MNRNRWVLLGAGAAAAVAAASVGFAGSPHAAAAQPFVSYACAGGSTDGATITADLSSLQEGGTLLLSGTCGSSSTPINITVPAGITLEGTDGADNNVGTEIDGTVRETSGESVTLHGFQVDCNGAADTGLTVDGWNVSINYVTVTDCDNGIELDNPTNGNGNHVNDWIDHVFMQGNSGTGYGLYVNDNGNGVTDGHISDSFFSGYKVSLYMSNAAGWYVTDNHTYGQSQEAIYANRMWGTTIRGNYIESWTGQGILGTVQGGAVGSVVAGNNVFQNDNGTVGSGSTAGHGIELDANYPAGFVTVTGNNVVGDDSTDSGSIGLYYSGAGARSLTVASSGNLVSGFHTKVMAVNGANANAGS